MTSLRSEYLRVPKPKHAEFWTPTRVQHIRDLAVTGEATPRWATRLPGNRALDRLHFPALDAHAGPKVPQDATRVDAATRLARGHIPMATPLYFGDMSYGALAGVPNVALARAADETGALAGTGEGGLHPDVAACDRIMVQWASGRFGVTPEVLDAGLGVVIKVGQGAKPGVGGHLPASKVTDVIRRTRRIPGGRDAISPAPHHDIYSIEDLGQRIQALKRLTEKPVIVKVAATNFSPYVACGIARMGADGVILDGAGAGTGASPSVMKDHVGVPVEFAVAGVDRMLRDEGLRDGFTVIAAGTVASALDAARLMALGADATSIGTASLVGMGCLMVHKCHVGACPALIATPAADDPKRALDEDWITRLQVNLVNGWTRELQGIARTLGLDRVDNLVGRRDLLGADGDLDADAARLFGVAPDATATRDAYGDAWNARVEEWVRTLAGTTGKSPGEAFVSSMGSTSPPFAEPAARPLDHLRVDGAQVTRPAIDSYREPVATHLTLRSGLRLAAPLLLGAPAARGDLHAPVAGAAHALGLLATPPAGEAWRRDATRYHARLVDPVDDVVLADGAASERPHVLRVPSTTRAVDTIRARAGAVDAVLVDEDLPTHGEDRVPVEVVVAEADRAAGADAPDLLVSSRTLRGAGDAFKLVALGAAGVAMPGVTERALAGAKDPARYRWHLEHLALGLTRELRLLLGAAGTSTVNAVRGNRELLRSINLDAETRERLGVKPAGWG